ncbi:hypothetical protein YB2330_003107 [Saitoella coloradoensis]
MFRSAIAARTAFRAYSTSAPATGSPVLLQIRNDMKAAMRAKDTSKLAVLKGVLADVTNASKTAKPIETDSAVFALLQQSILKRQETAADFRKHERTDLAEKEESEASVLKAYLPEQMKEGELTALIIDVCNKIQAGPKDMGKVMKEVANLVTDAQAPKKLVSELVRKALSSGTSSA